ncbi:MAG: bifunctional (p)ppGpp synthetase/guanosine-3',5'-bis(diphosphate) 3'-pyrophosphohydrolase [Candidatus Harrisonbacteria bacterium]|nr:bifunctional (p)ppGpp synthetase/guanosine-3',5'-bis(diphosphate) 3'-pyrophosphohydrolase [Candidatus Harrisonbacteria bacterium]
MNLTTKIEKAIKKAAALHTGQTRRFDNLTPYITHPFSVAIILSKYTNDENIVIAGLLHDTLEDTNYKPEEMAADFGAEVKDIVLGVSEPPTKEKDSRNWAERKEAYLDQLSKAPEGSLMVSAADKIHNLSSLIEEYETYGPKLLEKFHSSPAQRLGFDKKVLKIIRERLNNKIAEELATVIQRAENLFL